MNDNEPNDNAVLSAVREAISGLPVSAAPQLAAVTARGRAHRRRRLGLAAGAGVCAVLAVGLAVGGSLVGSPPQHIAEPAPQRQAVHLAAFTVVTDADGSTTLTLTKAQVVDPDALRAALAEHGIPAVVTAGEFCRTAQQPAPGVGDVAIFNGQRAAKQYAGQPAVKQKDGRTVQPNPGQPAFKQQPGQGPSGDTVVIYGSRIPRGVELSIGYRQDPQNREISFTLIQAGQPLMCTSIPDHAPH